MVFLLQESASDSRNRKKYRLEKLRTEHEELTQENEQNEELRQKVMDNKDELEYRIRMVKAEVERLRIVVRYENILQASLEVRGFEYSRFMISLKLLYEYPLV